MTRLQVTTPEALPDETGTGVAYFQGGDLGTPSAGVGTNLTALTATQLNRTARQEPLASPIVVRQYSDPSRSCRLAADALLVALLLDRERPSPLLNHLASTLLRC